MKSKILIIPTLLITSVTLACPGGKAGRSIEEFRINKISHELNLTEEQVIQYKTVVEKRNAKIKQAMDSIRSSSHTELNKFLTPEQMQKIVERNEHRRNHKMTRKARRERHSG
jgi:Spy/CpxP family protein refolding chaperone